MSKPFFTTTSRKCNSKVWPYCNSYYPLVSIFSSRFQFESKSFMTLIECVSFHYGCHQHLRVHNKRPQHIVGGLIFWTKFSSREAISLLVWVFSNHIFDHIVPHDYILFKVGTHQDLLQILAIFGVGTKTDSTVTVDLFWQFFGEYYPITNFGI